MGMAAGTGGVGGRRVALATLVLALLVALALTDPSLAGTARTERISLASDGTQGDGESSFGNSSGSSLSAHGRFVAFDSAASTLVGRDTNGATDVFVRDRMTGETKRVSLRSGGAQGNGTSFFSSISADGRFVAFTSDASNLVGNDTNDWWDVFVHDRRTGKTERVSLSSGGAQGRGTSFSSSISADGRFVAFVSGAPNLVGNDTNETHDVFVRDRRTGKTELVSLGSDGAKGNSSSFFSSISADGRFVAFFSYASNLVGGDTNGAIDVFVRDRSTRETKRVSLRSDGAQGGGDSSYPSISPDGRFVAFTSDASNLVGGDTNGVTDAFVRDRKTGETERVSLGSGGTQGNGDSRGSSISANGRFVAFPSDASNLVGGDTNDAIDVFVRGPLR